MAERRNVESKTKKIERKTMDNLVFLSIRSNPEDKLVSVLTERIFRQILEEVVTQDVAELQQQTSVDRLSFKDVVNVSTLTFNLLCDSNNRYSLLVHYFSNFLSDVHSFIDFILYYNK
jgi:hypothetical protein